MDMTIREIAENFGISRRAIQGYEKAGLVCQTGKNERGHLLYDEKAQMRIRKIRSFQQMGFSICEIIGMIDAPNNILKPLLEQQLVKLELQKEDIEALIHKMKALIDQM